MKCPSFERLLDYLDGKLAADESGPVMSHLEEGCDLCGSNARWYERVRTVVSGDQSTEPPPWVLKRAMRIFDAQRVRPNIVERIGRAVASLVFDSFAQPAAAGIRSTETTNRQLLYSTEDYSIDLQIAPSEQSGANLLGQVLREGDATFESVSNLSLELSREGKTVCSTSTTEMGEFSFKGVEQGEYDLSVETRNGSIVVRGLPVTRSL